MTASTLPPQTTAFVGRETELAEIGARLADPACRLLSLVGPGGIGKTRLALEVTARQRDRYPDGAVFVPLQALDSTEHIAQAVADALGLYLGSVIDPCCELLERLADLRLLLTLDNFEHLLDSAGFVADILAAAPGIQVLVTSREPLNLAEEWLWPVVGLSHPAGVEEDQAALAEYCAVKLFLARARRTRPGFDLAEELAGVARICALVEGLPLALELAATWVGALTCAEIADELAHGLDILESRTRNMPARHRSMRVVLAQSWERLTAAERDVFKRLAVFRGGFMLEAARAVAGATPTVLRGLVEKSLLRHAETGRYDLHELVRQFAEEQLRTSIEDVTATRDRHAAYYLEFVAGRWPDMVGAAPRQALDAIECDIDNVRAAWHWGAAMGLVNVLGPAVRSLWFFYDTRGWYSEGDGAFGLALEVMELDDDRREEALIRAQLLISQAWMRFSLSDFERAQALAEASLALGERTDSRPDIAVALFALGAIKVLHTEDIPAALEKFEAALAIFRAIGDRWFAAYTMNWMEFIALTDEQQRAYQEESYAIFRALGSQWGVAISLASMANQLWNSGEDERMIALAQEGLALCREIGIRWAAAMSLEAIGTGQFNQGNAAAAFQAYLQALTISVESLLPQYITRAVVGLARALHAMGDEERTVQGIAIALRYVLDRPEDSFINTFILYGAPPTLLDEARRRSERIELIPAAKALLADLSHNPPGEAQAAASGPPESGLLTERELEILQLVADGLGNREIAGKLFLSTGTVKWYLSQIYSKLGVRSRTQAVASAREWRLVR